MIVKLLHNTPLSVADTAIGKCYDTGCKTDVTAMKERINRVANVSKHSSTIEHLVYSFDIDGVSRALLQELARHRIASYSVKSTRYTLKELKKTTTDEQLREFLVQDKLNLYTVGSGVQALQNVREMLLNNVPNDIVKYALPEAYKTSLVMTINARALQNFLELRTSKHALWEIQDLAYAMYDVLPDNHRFLFERFVRPKD